MKIFSAQNVNGITDMCLNLQKKINPPRVLYFFYAVLWWYLNTNGIIISGNDAGRINVPLILYVYLPSLSLFLYAIFPLNSFWALPVTILVLGWMLHLYRSLAFSFIHMGVKDDMLGVIIFFLISLFILSICLAILYFSGPYYVKYLHNKELKKMETGHDNILE